MCRLTFIIALLLSVSSFGQKKGDPSFITAHYTEGILLAHHANMNHLVQKNNRGFELSYLRQRASDTLMSRVYDMPLHGLNLTYRNFGYNEVLGSGFALTYLLRFTLLQTRNNLCIEFQSQTGFGYVTKHYSKYDNPKNIAIGSHLNAKADLELLVTKFTKRFNYGFGIEFSHFSNGAIKNPNLGLNSLSLLFMGGYNFAKRLVPEKPLKFKERMKLKDDFPDHSLIAEVIASARQVADIPYKAKVYPVIGTRLTYVYRPRIKWGAVVSLDFVHNAANPHLWPEEGHKESEAYQLGIYTGAEAYFYKTVILFGLGYYLFDPVNASGKIYDRLGLQYYFTKNWYGLFAIKANFAKADYFEFGIGRRLKGWSKK